MKNFRKNLHFISLQGMAVSECCWYLYKLTSHLWQVSERSHYAFYSVFPFPSLQRIKFPIFACLLTSYATILSNSNPQYFQLTVDEGRNEVGSKTEFCS